MMNISRQYEELLKPSDALVSDMATLSGDILILGAGGKMGPALAKLASAAVEKSGKNKRIIAASRFSEKDVQSSLQLEGVETITADLLDDAQLQALPDVENVLYLAGVKFGTTGNEPHTWAMNAYLPAAIAKKYRHSKIVAFSTGNVYPLTRVTHGGATEELSPDPKGEYAQSCLGRERMFQYFSALYSTPALIYRLNYANDLSYGVLLEIAKSVRDRKQIDLAMGNVNVIWQGDANEIALRCLHHCSTPPKLLNVTGSEILSVRWIANEFGNFFDTSPIFVGEEEPTALISNAAECHRLFGYPRVTTKQMIALVAGWLLQGGKTLNKETHFQERAGQF